MKNFHLLVDEKIYLLVDKIFFHLFWSPNKKSPPGYPPFLAVNLTAKLDWLGKTDRGCFKKGLRVPAHLRWFCGLQSRDLPGANWAITSDQWKEAKTSGDKISLAPQQITFRQVSNYNAVQRSKGSGIHEILQRELQAFYLVLVKLI